MTEQNSQHYTGPERRSSCQEHTAVSNAVASLRGRMSLIVALFLAIIG